MARTFSTLVAYLCFLLFFSGCAIVDLRSSQMPDADLSSIKTLYVVRLEQDNRNIHYIIQHELDEMGFQANAGSTIGIPNDIDAIVTYEDRWYWDLGNYMLKLNIEIRNPKTNYPLAVGESLRTSLARKTPSEMAREILESIFKDGE